jgi:hypothetical protein
VNGGTRIIALHLEKEHHVLVDTPRQRAIKKRQISIQDAMETAKLNPRKRRRTAPLLSWKLPDVSHSILSNINMLLGQ